MNSFFEPWVLSLDKNTQNFHVRKSTVADAHSKWTQPRVKFCFTQKNTKQEFNIRLDYNKKSIEMDVGWVAFNLKKWGTIIDYLDSQCGKSIVSNSYAHGAKGDTARIVNVDVLIFEEQMALIHSALMQQWCDVLGREEGRTFSYHYVLRKDVSPDDFNNLIDLF